MAAAAAGGDGEAAVMRAEVAALRLRVQVRGPAFVFSFFSSCAAVSVDLVKLFLLFFFSLLVNYNWV
jgi:hypothetical protein